MKCQALFYLKDKIEKLKCRLLQFLFDALRVKSVAKEITNQKCTISLHITHER